MIYILSAIAVFEFLYIIHLRYEMSLFSKTLETIEKDLVDSYMKRSKLMAESTQKITDSIKEIEVLNKALEQRDTYVKELETKLEVFSEGITMGKPPRAKKPHRKPKITK